MARMKRSCSSTSGSDGLLRESSWVIGASVGQRRAAKRSLAGITGGPFGPIAERTTDFRTSSHRNEAKSGRGKARSLASSRRGIRLTPLQPEPRADSAHFCTEQTDLRARPLSALRIAALVANSPPRRSGMPGSNAPLSLPDMGDLDIFARLGIIFGSGNFGESRPCPVVIHRLNY